MSVLKRPAATTPPHCQQITMTPARKSMGGTNGSPGKDVKQRVNLCMNKLADRDTEALGASELESMARDLPAESLLSFISAISDTRPSDKIPLRRHCVRLLSFLSRTRQPQSLAPFLPRMLAAVLRRIRDPDSSVRAACVDAVRDMCRSSASSFFFKPLSESLLLEQDVNAQVASAMCLAAAIDEVSTAVAARENRGARGHELAQQLQRLVPRLAKLAKSDSFKAKPALLSLIGSFVAAGGASTASLLGILIPCLVDALAFDDWAARKAAAEALTRVAAIPDLHLLASFKSSYFSSFQARRFDKVKIVRESMNQMLEAWKDVPGALVEEDVGRGRNSQSSQSPSGAVQKGNVTDGQPLAGARTSSFNQSATPLPARKSRSPVNSSSPSDALSTPTRRTPPTTGKRMHQPILSKFNYEKPSDWKIEIVSPQAPPSTIVSRREVLNDKERGGTVWEQCKIQETSGSRQEVNKLAFEHSEGRVNKRGCANSGSCVIPFQENGMPDHTVESDNVLTGNKDSELCVIRKQLVQIENQQSSLLDFLQLAPVNMFLWHSHFAPVKPFNVHFFAA
ncbi:hypothetical protein Taro_046717 [Colocasia esculenta]|uniref:TORTIFOLIA1/SINE1-2 N-terminal domain-containing protein n=1 Tax=Colocasia esculenta TaxID=4460 RepID=A0A843X4H7_COLES|nr:hypothetical protein [Colocasia esculenta]